MLCPHCGGYAEDQDVLCPGCGALLDHGENHESGVRSIRQGRRGSSGTARRPASAGKAGASRMYVDSSTRENDGESRVYADPQIFHADGTPLVTGYDRPVRGVYGDTTRQQQVLLPAGVQRRKNNPLARRMINWTHVVLGLLAALILVVVGVYFYVERTAGGQKILARMGRDATTTAMWEVGEEILDTGDIDRAIAMFEAAREKDGEENINVDGLLTLGSAYEAAGRISEAEELYRQIYTDITPSAPEAYRNVIRILLSTDRAPEASELMQTAWEQTGVNTFRQQRQELLPQTPLTDLTAGYYTEKRNVTLISPESFDVYYTFDEEAELPAEGELYSGPIFLDEGTWNMRAVAVNGDLVSDPLTAVYKVYMPAPQTPNCSLAPNTYKQRQRVRIWPGPENKKDTDITIYYTIDGSNPDADSPVYTGDPVALPGNKVTLKAVAVNSHGKVSNMLTVEYKILAKPYPKDSYSVEDTVNGLKLYATTREQFQDAHGVSDQVEEVYLTNIPDVCLRYTYSWGYATMAKTKNGWVLAELYFTSSQFAGPRSTGIGDTESQVVGKFRDMGQLESASGNRGLYENDKGKGKIYKQEDGTKLIRYQAKTSDSHMWQLDYTLGTGGVVTAIRMQFIP